MTKGDWFQPTCPRCLKKAPIGAKWCPFCGLWLLYDKPPKRPKQLDQSVAA